MCEPLAGDRGRREQVAPAACWRPPPVALFRSTPPPRLLSPLYFFLTQPRPRGFFYQIPLWQNIQVTVTSPGPSRFHQVQKGPTRCHQVPKKGSTRFQPLGCFTQCLLALEEAEALVEKGDKSTPNLRTAMQEKQN